MSSFFTASYSLGMRSADQLISIPLLFLSHCYTDRSNRVGAFVCAWSGFELCQAMHVVFFLVAPAHAIKF